MRDKIYFFIRRNNEDGKREVLTSNGFVKEEILKEKDFNKISFFGEDEIHRQLEKYDFLPRRCKVWSVRYNTSNLFLRNFGDTFLSVENIYNYIRNIKASPEHIKNIFNLFKSNFPTYEFKISTFLTFVDPRELFSQEKEKVKFVKVEFIPQRKRTTLIFSDKTLIRTDYEGEVGDKDFSNKLAFLYGVYKYKHQRLSSEALHNKLKIVLGNWKNNDIVIYLSSFFIESGLFSPTKSKKILKQLDNIDKCIERTKINFGGENNE